MEPRRPVAHPESRQANLPQLQICRLSERHSEARILARGKGEIGQRRQGGRSQRVVQAVREPLILTKVDAGEPRPSGAREQATQGEEVVVLAFVPHSITPESAHQVRDEPRVAFDDPLRQLFVLKPHGDGGERGAVPCLPVGESLVVITDERRCFLDELIHAPGRRVVELIAGAQHRRGRDIVARPERLEVGGEKQAARPEDVVAVGVAPVALRVGVQDVAGARRRRPIAGVS